MDSGEVLQGLDEQWEFMGANGVEWVIGFVSFLLVSLFGRSTATSMPLMLLAWVGTTTTIASLRRLFPDEHRGMRNLLLTSCGVTPPGLPSPARLQPVWSACPIREVPPTCRFRRLGLERLFPLLERDRTEPEV